MKTIHRFSAFLIDEYIHFYNHQRIQIKTKLTPLEKRCQFCFNFSYHRGDFVLSTQFGAVQFLRDFFS
ncbi:MAG: IS3 family transposase [Clostridia bacterium]|nr:IS3 family transposase [Clostridia bacterium]